MTCAIAGIGQTAFTRTSGRTTRAMAVEACRKALADAGLGIDAVDAVDGMICFQTGDSSNATEVHALGREELSWSASVYEWAH